MKKIYFLSVLSVVLIRAVSAQNFYSHQLIVVNGGQFNNPNDYVTVASFDLQTKTYSVFDEIKTQSTQDVEIDGDFAYVAAQDSLVKYDISNYTRVAAIKLDAIRKLAIYNDKLIVTRQYPATDDFVYILNKNDLSEISILQTSGESGDLVIVEDTAYVAVTGFWGTAEGKVAVLDLQNDTILREINFGTDAKGLREVFYKDSILFTVNTHFSDYTNNIYSVSKYNIYNGNIITDIFNDDYYGFYGYSILADSIILIPRSMDIAAYNINDGSIAPFIDLIPAALTFDKLYNKIYITESNYTDWGKLYCFDLSGQPMGDTLNIGVSPEAITIDYREIPFTDNDVNYWIGEGANKAILVIDWNDSTSNASMAWGFRWNGNATAEDMINSIDSADTRLEFNINSGFLMDIIYTDEESTHSGIGGNPDYWSTWSSNNCIDWYMNMGISEELSDGSWFGCSYRFNPSPTQPDIPTAASICPNNIYKMGNDGLKVYIYPNPFADYVTIESKGVQIECISILDETGTILKSFDQSSNRTKIYLADFNKGLYILRIKTNKGFITKKIIKN